MMKRNMFALLLMLCSMWAAAQSDVKGVCAFDIDYTLACDGATAAVQACKDAGFALAIDTARTKDHAYEALDSLLAQRGFDQAFIAEAKQQQGLAGPFQYRADWQYDQPTEQHWAQKSYGLRNIAKYYDLRLDDKQSKRLILFDDLPTNVDQARPGVLDSGGECVRAEDGNCYADPYNAPRGVYFPRNWKIYSGKWIGFLCARWADAETAKQDVQEMIAGLK